jgi:outer membrane protein OmpA-like peptidoglycan-associated protein
MLIVALVMLASQLSMAQAFNYSRFEFSDTLETLGVEDALGANSELAQKKFLLKFSYNYIQDPMFGNDNGRGIYPKDVRDMHSYTLGFGSMISKRFFLSATMAAHRVETYAASPDAKTEIGDIKLQAKYRITGDNAGVNFALIPFFYIPTGDKDLFVGRDELSYGLKLAADTTLGAVKFFANLGYAYSNQSLDRVRNFDRTNILTSAFGMFYRANSWLGFNLEYNRDYALDGGDFKNIQGLDLAVRLKSGNVNWFVGSGIESARSFEYQDFNIYAGAKFAFGSQKEQAKMVEQTPEPVDAVAEVRKDLSVKREINFKTGSTVIKEESHQELDTAAAAIVKYQDQIETIVVEGHSDSTGSALKNKTISQKRAESVKAYLVSKGVDASKVSAVGYGEERLEITPERTAADRATNRRVEFKVNPKVK